MYYMTPGYQVIVHKKNDGQFLILILIRRVVWAENIVLADTIKNIQTNRTPLAILGPTFRLTSGLCHQKHALLIYNKAVRDCIVEPPCIRPIVVVWLLSYCVCVCTHTNTCMHTHACMRAWFIMMSRFIIYDFITSIMTIYVNYYVNIWRSELLT